MRSITVQNYTTKEPISMIGAEAGVCWGADTSDPEKNYKRGLDCLKSGHGRTFEFPDVYIVIEGYSARVIREWYTHIGGAPTRLQESTRYIDYQKGFDYVSPPSIQNNPVANTTYKAMMGYIMTTLQTLENLGIPREDSALCLPLGMETKIVCKHNLRNLMDMSHQRLCSRAYHEYRALFKDVMSALSDYSEEWKFLVDNYFMPKCMQTGFCTEKYSCGMMPKKEEKV